MKTIPQISGGFLGNIEELKGRKGPEALKAAAKEFEAMFAYEMIKAMRETTESGKSGFGKETYMSLFDMELARILADRGFGLKEMLLKGLDKQLKADEKGAESGAGPISRAPARDHVPPATAAVSGVPTVSAAITEPSGVPAVPDMEQQMPVDGSVSSAFGMRRHPVYGDQRFHHGIDIAAPEGTGVYPYRGGKVIFSGRRPGYGNVVVIDHGNGLVSKYAHNRVNLVEKGAVVDENTVIAEVGSTGLSTGPHLHFEVRRNGEPIDPAGMVAMKKD